MVCSGVVAEGPAGVKQGVGLVKPLGCKNTPW